MRFNKRYATAIIDGEAQQVEIREGQNPREVNVLGYGYYQESDFRVVEHAEGGDVIWLEVPITT